MKPVQARITPKTGADIRGALGQRFYRDAVAAVQEFGNGMARPCSAAYLLEEEATALWREPTVKLQ